jgi:predicted nucleic acid-binding protein
VKRYLLDTGSASDLINRRGATFSKAREEAARGARVGVCTPVVGELFAGVELSRNRKENRATPVRALELFGACGPLDRASTRLAAGRVPDRIAPVEVTSCARS